MILKKHKPEPQIWTLEWGHFLSEIWGELPAGLINKNATGAGATHLELECNRSSIIVFPTRALAASKAKKHGSFYVGSDYFGITETALEDIKEAMINGKRIKVSVVMDSLPRLLEVLGKQVYEYFHLTIDEADCLQSEVDYRPAMEKGLDMYWKFASQNRTMVSATLQTFSDPALKEEPVTEIEWLGKPLDEIYLFHEYGDILSGVITKIRELRKHFPDNKILIAYNSVSKITKVAEFFKDELKGEIGLLCSEKAMEEIADEFKGNVKGGVLSHSVMLMTSAYFYGLDIDERLSMMVVADVKAHHTLLSKEKIQQVFGRARPGCSVKILLFKTIHATKDPIDLVNWNVPALSEHLLELIMNVNQTPDLIFSKGYKEQIINSVINGGRIAKANLIRITGNEFHIRHLVVDHLLQIQDSIKELYNDPWTAMDTLAWDYFVELHKSEHDLDGKDLKGLESIIQKAKTADKVSAIAYANLMQDDFTLNLDPPKNIFDQTMYNLGILVRSTPRLKNSFFLNKAMEIANKLDTKRLNSLLRKAQVYSGYPDSKLWKQFGVHFEFGESYNADQIFNCLGIIRDTTQHPSLSGDEFTKTTAVQWFKNVFLTSIDKRTYPGRNSYRLKSDRSKDLISK